MEVILSSPDSNWSGHAHKFNVFPARSVTYYYFHTTFFKLRNKNEEPQKTIELEIKNALFQSKNMTQLITR